MAKPISKKQVEFFTIKENTIAEIVEKKSKFIANLCYIETEEQAQHLIKEIKKKYHDARHNCVAYRVIENESIIEKASDDGEPSGTAGAPMLNILQKNNLNNILVVVTRYFGGILLGTGGLVRAYSGVVEEALRKAQIIEKARGYEVKIQVNYDNLENLRYHLEKMNIKILKVEYAEKIEITIDILKNNLEEITKNNKLKIEKQNILKEKFVEI